METPTHRLLLSLTAALFLCASGRAQQPLPDGSIGGGPLSAPGMQPRPSTNDHGGIYRDLDLLRSNGFSTARSASVALRVYDRSGFTPGNLQAADFTLIVNGTPRPVRVHAPGSADSTIPPMVLLVLPPNQSIVHNIAIKNAEKYFAAQPGELLPWRVGIFDSNGKMTPYTNGRSQLLANLDVVDHTPEPFQYASSAGLPRGLEWEGSWLLKAEDAIGMMQRFEGPKVVLAINPLAEPQFGLNEGMMAHNGPDSLAPIAKAIGAHIYIANVGGPEVYIPGGGAADYQPAQINTPAGPLLGTTPSYHQQVDPQMIAALNFYAYRTSEMMQTAKDTFGGYSNSLADLAAKIHTDLDGNYTLDFAMSPEDTDKGPPSVEVRMTRRDLRVAIVDLEPIGSTAEANRDLVSRRLMDTIAKATVHPVLSPNFRIVQHVDYFPLHFGLEPILPMSGAVEWTGQGVAPAQIFVVESVEDPNLATTILERSIQARWDGHSLSWERDGTLLPGNYIWRVAIHDGTGKVYASAADKVSIPFPRDIPIGISSLVLGKSCRDVDSSTSGLAHRPITNAPAASATQPEAQAHLLIDPMRAAGCRVKPEPTGRFTPADRLHAFVRIYPAARLASHRPESWTARFVLRAGLTPSAGPVESEQEIPFTTDSGSGYLARIDLPLNTPAIAPGPHTLEVAMRGPGIKGNSKASRSIVLVAPPQKP